MSSTGPFDPSNRRVDSVVLASANPKKVAELSVILTAELGRDVEVVPRPAELPDVEETGTTFLDNARLKAVAVGAATGMVAVADDSGLEVVALGGEPGVRSARFAGAAATDGDNLSLLLSSLAGESDRRARFVCTLIARFPDGHEVVATGAVGGTIARSPRGGNGFGYDPVFVPDATESPDADGRTFAEMEPAEKAGMSHRGRAVVSLAEQLAALSSP